MLSLFIDSAWQPCLPFPDRPLPAQRPAAKRTLDYLDSQWLAEVGRMKESRVCGSLLATKRKQAAEKPLNAVILSEALDRTVQGEAKNLGSCNFNELRRSFVVRQ
jgi:hypothetical protein